jgi:hypothetical protein
MSFLSNSQEQSFKSYYEENPSEEQDKLGAYAQNSNNARFNSELTFPPRFVLLNDNFNIIFQFKELVKE